MSLTPHPNSVVTDNVLTCTIHHDTRQTIDRRADHIPQHFISLHDEISSLDTKLQSVKSNIDEKFNSLNATFDTRLNRLDTKLDGKINSLNTKFDDSFHTLNDKIDTWEHKLDDKINTLGTKFNSEINRLQINLFNEINKITKFGDHPKQPIYEFNWIVISIEIPRIKAANRMAEIITLSVCK